MFCKIASGEIAVNKIHEDELCLVFHDISPQAPIHLLVIPKIHIPSVVDLDNTNSSVVAHIYKVIAQVANSLKLNKGLRVVTNYGEDGGQTVGHLHFHVLAGRPLAWPPG